MDQIIYPELSNNLYPDIQPQISMLSQAINKLPFTLPQSFPVLEANIINLPFYIKNNNLYKQLCNYNKKLIYEQFQLICVEVMQVYQESYRNASYFNLNQYTKLIYAKICQKFVNANYYINSLPTSLQNINHSSDLVYLLRSIMTFLAECQINYYKIPTSTSSFIFNQQFSLDNNKQYGKIPQKYQTIIQQKLNRFIKPVNMNYFQALIANTVQDQSQNNSYENIKTQEQMQAQKTANAIKKLLVSKYIEANTAKIASDKQNKYLPNSMGNNFLPPEPNFQQRTDRFNRNALQRSVLQNLALSIQNQQLNNNRNLGENYNTPLHEFQEGDWLYDNISQMSYYQSYMMVHMADLIFLHPNSFDIKLIKYYPYLNTLNQEIMEQVNNIKSELIVLKILHESQIKYLNQQKIQQKKVIQIWSNNKTDPIQANTEQMGKKKQNKFFGKALKTFQKLYQKTKNQFSNQSNNVNYCGPDCVTNNNGTNNPSVDYNDYLKQNQSMLLPQYIQKIQYQYTNITQSLQKFSQFLFKLSQITANGQTSQNLNTNQKQVGFFQKIMHLPSNSKLKNNQQNAYYYHQFQSWIAIIIILYKQLAFNQLSNYQYTPLKRRILIRIFKRIFIKEKNKQSKSMKYHGFRNWSVILKYLQNNRPQIMYDKLGKANEKAVDLILNQFYQVIREKRMVGSTFGGIFDGLPPLKQTIPQIKLVCLSAGTNTSQNLNKNKSSTQCKVVHILISGFLSEDTDKLSEWSDMVDIMADCEIYALVWQSSTIKNLVKFFLRSAVDILGAIKMMDQLRRKYTNNPFNPAFEVAQVTGRILGQIIKRTFPNRFINICGYSLGSEVIKQFLKGVIRSKSTTIINNIYLMGGVSDTNQFQNLVAQSRTPISLYNCYTNNDSVLRHLLSLCKPEIKPIGLNELKKVGGHSIINVDCTKFISGHLAFRSNLSIMGQVLEISTG